MGCIYRSYPQLQQCFGYPPYEGTEWNYLYPIPNHYVTIHLSSCYDSRVVQLKYVELSHMNAMFFNSTIDTWMDIK